MQNNRVEEIEQIYEINFLSYLASCMSIIKNEHHIIFYLMHK